ncbi:hypothetical protein [Streptosporangium roseum]|uniref:hypothetical protein n=1 Tax=Streptosporangium roseum TaxID=2001 RepID=UPI00068C07A2|nr:hypothetical protein [Streptosporangium roseum]
MTANTTQAKAPQDQARAAQAELAAAYPEWTIWRSNTGRWYATRKAPITKAEGIAGCVRTVHAVDPEELAGKLAEQQKRAQKAGAS